MTTEERVLKTKYGSNYDAVTMSSGNLKIRNNSSNLYSTPQRAKTGKVRGEDPYANSFGTFNRGGQSDIAINSPQLIYQRQE